MVPVYYSWLMSEIFTSDLEALENYAGTPFLPLDSDILLDSPDQDDIGKLSSFDASCSSAEM
jgi:hypothetical protein